MPCETFQSRSGLPRYGPFFSPLPENTEISIYPDRLNMPILPLVTELRIAPPADCPRLPRMWQSPNGQRPRINHENQAMAWVVRGPYSWCRYRVRTSDTAKATSDASGRTVDRSFRHARIHHPIAAETGAGKDDQISGRRPSFPTGRPKSGTAQRRDPGFLM
jgi:hypothetical protein